MKLSSYEQKQKPMVQSTLLQRVSRGITLGTLAAALLISDVNRVEALNPQPEPPGTVGLVSGQVIRWTVFNTEPLLGRAALPPGPCQVNLSFVNNDGNVLAESGPLEIGAGKATSFDLAVTGGGDAFGRTQIRGVCTALDRKSVQMCSPNLEVFDAATGKTSLWLPPNPCVTP